MNPMTKEGYQLPLSDEEVKRIRACIHVDVGGGAFMAAPLDNLEWQLRYGSPEAVRFEAASVVASYRHLIYLSKEKAWHRLQRMRYDLKQTGSRYRVQAPRRDEK